MINDSNLDNVFTENDNQEAFDYKGEKGILSKVGFSYFFLLLIMFFIPSILLSFTYNPSNDLVLAYNFIAFIVGAIVLHYSSKGIPNSKNSKKHDLSLLKYLAYFVMGYGLMILGYSISGFIQGLFINNAVNPIQTFESSNMLVTFLYAILLGPIFEEYFFRKVLIDKISRYGELFAVLVSAFMFMIYHMNFYQFIGVFLMGVVLGHVYVKTRRIEYTITLHQLANFFGLFVPMLIGTSVYAGIFNYFCIVIMFLAVILSAYLILTVKYDSGDIEIPENKTFGFFFKNASVCAFIIFGLFIGVLNLGVFA